MQKSREDGARRQQHEAVDGTSLGNQCEEGRRRKSCEERRRMPYCTVISWRHAAEGRNRGNTTPIYPRERLGPRLTVGQLHQRTARDQELDHCYCIGARSPGERRGAVFPVSRSRRSLLAVLLADGFGGTEENPKCCTCNTADREPQGHADRSSTRPSPQIARLTPGDGISLLVPMGFSHAAGIGRQQCAAPDHQSTVVQPIRPDTRSANASVQLVLQGARRDLPGAACAVSGGTAKPPSPGHCDRAQLAAAPDRKGGACCAGAVRGRDFCGSRPRAGTTSDEEADATTRFEAEPGTASDSKR